MTSCFRALDVELDFGIAVIQVDHITNMNLEKICIQKNKNNIKFTCSLSTKISFKPLK